jgi:hypothetical protein
MTLLVSFLHLLTRSALIAYSATSAKNSSALPRNGTPSQACMTPPTATAMPSKITAVIAKILASTICSGVSGDTNNCSMVPRSLSDQRRCRKQYRRHRHHRDQLCNRREPRFAHGGVEAVARSQPHFGPRVAVAAGGVAASGVFGGKRRDNAFGIARQQIGEVGVAGVDQELQISGLSRHERALETVRDRQHRAQLAVVEAAL